MQVIQRRMGLHPAQIQFLRSDALYRGFVGGRGSGKTVAGSYDLFKRALHRCGLYYAVSPSYPDAEDVALRAFPKLLRDLSVSFRIKRTPPQRVTLSNGAEVVFRSGDDPDDLRGPNLSGIWLDEASKMARGVFDVAIACLREGGEQGWLSATFTPKGKQHWTYEQFGTDKPDTALFHARTRDNPFLPNGFEDTIRRQYPAELAEQELGGRFISLVGGRFKAEWFRRYRLDGEILWLDDGSQVPLRFLTRVGMVDPANRKTKQSKYTALLVSGYDQRGRLFILDLEREQLSVEDINPRLNSLCAKWAPLDWCGYEANGFQLALVQEARDRRRFRAIPPVLEMMPEGKSKLNRAHSAIILAQEGGIYLPQRSSWADYLLSELTSFTGDEKEDVFTDATDCLAYTVKGMQQLGTTGAVPIVTR